MSDISLYEQSPELYEKLQRKRPDYMGALNTFYDLAHTHLAHKKDIVIADFCCGAGTHTKRLAEELSVSKAILIDTNSELLKIAESSGIKAELDLRNQDILSASLLPVADIVISMFAYHHVPDEKKKEYVAQIDSALKIGGILVLGEIYSLDKDTTSKYYAHLLKEIGPTDTQKELEQFLTQTAESSDFEYKVSREFAHTQLKEAGFALIESMKVWPTDNSFPEDVGTFVEVWKHR